MIKVDVADFESSGIQASMEVIVSGGSGFVGLELCRTLLARLDTVKVLTRDVSHLSARFRDRVQPLEWTPGQLGPWARDVDGADAVVNLAGEPIDSGYWTSARKRRLVSSRLDSKRSLMRAISEAEDPPSVIISASAAGYYGDRGDEVLNESSPPGDDFLADLCVNWESEGLELLPDETRHISLRIGLVLDESGGLLGRMLPAFRYMMGATLGSGEQWMSWISRHDLARLIVFLIDHRDASGAINATAPEPVRQREFVNCLSEELNRPSFLRVPGFLIKLVLGDLGTALLASQRIKPVRARQLGFAFDHPGLTAALRDILD